MGKANINQRAEEKLYLQNYTLSQDTFVAMDNYQQHDKRPLHSHDFYEIFVVTQGKLVHRYNGTQKTLQKGDMQLVLPFDVHSFEGDTPGDNRLCNLAFSQAVFSKMQKCISRDIGKDTTKTVQLSPFQYQALWTKIQLYFDNYINAEDCLLSVLLDYLLYASSTFPNGQTEKTVPIWLRNAIYEMEKLENLRLGLPRFIQLSGKSQEYLSRMMKAWFKITTTQWINSHRLEISRQLLVSSDLPILEIILEVGFDSESYFYRMFKDYFGVTPLNYRKAHQRADD